MKVSFLKSLNHSRYCLTDLPQTHELSIHYYQVYVVTCAVYTLLPWLAYIITQQVVMMTAEHMYSQATGHLYKYVNAIVHSWVNTKEMKSSVHSSISALMQHWFKVNHFSWIISQLDSQWLLERSIMPKSAPLKSVRLDWFWQKILPKLVRPDRF